MAQHPEPVPPVSFRGGALGVEADAVVGNAQAHEGDARAVSVHGQVDIDVGGVRVFGDVGERLVRPLLEGVDQVIGAARSGSKVVCTSMRCWRNGRARPSTAAGSWSAVRSRG